MDRTRELTDLTASRALFALWVFVYHANLHADFAPYLGWFGGIITHGYLGVDGFFILSGFILTRVDRGLGIQPGAILRFWGKRLARIYPLHLAVILILAALFFGGLAAGITPRDPSRFGHMALLDHLLLIQAWGSLRHWAWNYPSWSISAEWAGYLIFPFVLAALVKIDPMVVGSVFPLCFMLLGLLSSFHGGLNLTFGDSFARFSPEFLVGMASGIIVPLWADGLSGRLFMAIGAIGAVFAAVLGHDALGVFFLWLLILGFAFDGDAERDPTIGWIRPLHGLGVISYAIYMSFAPAELMTSQIFRHVTAPPSIRGLAYAVVIATATLILALLLHRLVELPARIMLTRRLDPEKAAALAAGSLPL